MSANLRRFFFCVVVGLTSVSSSAASPDLTDGLSVLFVLSNPYTANAGAWSTALDRRGYDVTWAGVTETIASLDGTGSPIRVDLTLDGIEDVARFDAVFLVSRSVDPVEITTVARDLRSSPAALDLLRDADAAGLALYVGASSFGVLLDGGLVDGHSVLCHAALLNDCTAAGGACAASRTWIPPLRDGNLVTGTSWFSFPIENVEEIGRALDVSQSHSRSLESLVSWDPSWSGGSTPLDAPIQRADTWGGRRNDGAVSVCAIQEGFALAGYTFSGASGTADVLVMCYDADGELLWQRSLGGPGRDYGEAVCATQGGGCVVAGFTTSAGSGSEDVLLARYAADGSVLWVKTYGGQGSDMALGVCATQDGGFVFCGFTTSEGAGGSDSWVVKVDGDGAMVWSATLGTNRYERAYAVEELETGELALIASATTSTGAYDSQLVRLDSLGRVVGSTPVSLPTPNVLEDFTRGADGSVFAVGYADSTQAEAVGVVTALFGASATQRAPIWVRRAERSGAFDYGASVLVLGEGDLWVCGTASGADLASTDVLFARLSRSGYLQSSARCGDAGRSERLEDACWVSSDRAVAVGHCESAAGDQDVLLLFVDPELMP